MFTLTKQREIFPKAITEKFYVKDELLSDCIGRGRKCSNNYSNVEGFNSRKGFGYALLTYFTSRALNIHRMPFCLDRIYQKYVCQIGEHDKKILDYLSQEKVEMICNELVDLYLYTQKNLRNAGLKYVNLRRQINYYSSDIIDLIKSAKLLNLSNINIEMDTLNSYGESDEYPKDFYIEMKIPIDNILYCSVLIGSDHCSEVLVEEGEWVVINKSPTGVVSIPLKSININRENSSLYIPTVKTTKDAEAFLSNYSPVYINPFYDYNREFV